MCFVVCERRCVGAVNVSGPVRRAPMRHRDARVDGPVAFDTKYQNGGKTMTNGNAATHADGVTRWVFTSAFL